MYWELFSCHAGCRIGSKLDEPGLPIYQMNEIKDRGRLCGHDVMDDLMVPAHRGKEGRTERGPSSISHKVSVGSASKPRRERRFGHSKGQEEKVTCRRKKTRHIQGTFSGRVTYTSPNVWPCHQGGSVATRRISPII